MPCYLWSRVTEDDTNTPVSLKLPRNKMLQCYKKKGTNKTLATLPFKLVLNGKVINQTKKKKVMLASIPVMKKSKHKERKSMEDLECSFCFDI